MKDKIRSFIAVELPEHIRSTIFDVQKGLKPGIKGMKWVKPENIHLTLRFLGDIGRREIDGAKDAIGEAAREVSPFFLSAKGMGAFPGLSRPRVMWIGLGGEVEKLRELSRIINIKLDINGIEREQRKFKGHLTIGRVKGRINPAQLIESIKKMKDFESEAFSVDRIILFKSELKPEGPTYTELYAADL